MNLARIFNLTGQRERAVTEYQAAVRTNDNTGNAVDEAIRFLQSVGGAVPEREPPPKKIEFHIPPGVYPVRPGITAPVPAQTEPPEYSEEARLAELEGTVWLAVVVGTDGTPRGIQVIRPLGLGLDEKAVEAVRNWRFWPGVYQGNEVPALTTIPVDFVLPSKHSRWHLIRATFRPPDGVSRPLFRSVAYPPGGGVSMASMDHARVVSAVGRQATATVSFDINEHGRPVGFKVNSASEERWGR